MRLVTDYHHEYDAKSLVISSGDRFLTKQQLAGYLSISTRTIERLVHKGIPHTRVADRLRFKACDVESWLAKGGENA